MTTANDCFMLVKAEDGVGSAWEDAGDICHSLNGTLAVVEDDDTMFKVNKHHYLHLLLRI